MLPPITGTDLNGERIVAAYGQGEKRTVVLAFAAKCRYCEANWRHWETLLGYDWFRDSRVVFVNVSGDVPDDYFRRHEVNSALVVKAPDASTKLAYNFRLAPQTILIGRDGRVQGTWSGVLSPNHLKQLVKTMTADYNPRR